MPTPELRSMLAARCQGASGCGLRWGYRIRQSDRIEIWQLCDHRSGRRRLPPAGNLPDAGRSLIPTNCQYQLHAQRSRAALGQPYTGDERQPSWHTDFNYPLHTGIDPNAVNPGAGRPVRSGEPCGCCSRPCSQGFWPRSLETGAFRLRNTASPAFLHLLGRSRRALRPAQGARRRGMAGFHCEEEQRSDSRKEPARSASGQMQPNTP